MKKMNKKKPIVFDLDGVLRDLDHSVAERFHLTNINEEEYYWTSTNGDRLEDLVNKDLNILLDVYPSEYAEIIKDYIIKNNSEIWTAQFLHWQDLTYHWIMNYFSPYKPKIRFIRPREKYGYTYIEDCYLVEDRPYYDSYSRIILIDKPYNRNVKDPLIRIHNPEELKKILELLGK